jgi:GNAT superfamily N-acetyltransferase
MNIRAARPTDADPLFELAASFATSFRLDKETFRIAYRRLVSRDDVAILVAEDAGKLVGYLLGFTHDTFFANGPVAWIEELTVVEAQRRNGIGTGLVERFEKWALARNAKMIALATRRAASFYEKAGYEESATYFRKTL